MKITAIQLLEGTNRQNENSFHMAMSHLTMIVNSHVTGIATSTDPNLKAAFEGTLANAKKFLAIKPEWQRAEVDIKDIKS